MATKYYGINDKWTDDDIENVIEITSEDGSVDSVKVNGEEYEGGGDNINYSLLASGEITTESPSTTSKTLVTTLTGMPDAVKDTSKVLLVVIKDTADPQASYINETITIFLNNPTMADPSINSMVRVLMYWADSLTSDIAFYDSGNAYGIYADSIDLTSGDISIYMRQNSSGNFKVDGTYTYEIYSVDYIPGTNPLTFEE